MALPVPVERTDQRLDLLAGDRAGAQQGYAAVEDRDHGTLHTDSAIPTVDMRGRERTGLLGRVGEGGGAGAAGAVGGRGDDRAAEGGDDGAGAGVAGHPDGDAVQTGAGQVADPVTVADRCHDGQGPGPEGLGQGSCPRVEHGDGLGLNGIGDMGDQGVEARAALGLEDGGHRDGVSGVGGEAIDGLGREDHEAAVGQDAGGLGVGHSQARRA